MNKPMLFIFFLILVLFFILGVRYGQKVEKNNKVVDYILKVTPTKTIPSPTPIKYVDYKSKKWGVKFTYPSNLEIKEDATSPAVMINVKNK
jgi:hypothetical protein